MPIYDVNLHHHFMINVSFFGSSSFSISTLKALFTDTDIDVKSIITMPPAIKNRGKKISNNIVQDFALQSGFSAEKIFTPKTLRNNDTLLNELRQEQLDFIVVVAYGKIITKDIIDLPNFEILNLHPSSLPKYRGAAPIERTIEAGEKETEICIMKVDVGLDTGDVARREKYTISADKTASEIIPEISNIGSQMMLKTIHDIFNKVKVNFIPQISNDDLKENEKYAKKIEKSELFIDIQDENNDAIKIFNKIRAFDMYGGCYFEYNNNRIKVLKASLKQQQNDIIGFNKANGCLNFKNGTIIPILLQKEGKKPVGLKDFLNGLKNC